MNKCDYYSIYQQIAKKYLSKTTAENALFLCLLFNALHTIEFLSSDEITQLSNEKKQKFLVSIANMYVREYKFHNDILRVIAERKELAQQLDIFTDITSHIIEYCNQAAPQDRLPHLLDGIPEKIQKIVTSL